MSKLVAANSGCNWRVSHLGGSGVAVRGSGADNTGVMDEREGSFSGNINVGALVFFCLFFLSPPQ